ncbi:lipocalin family protein [Stieleria sp. TO1_6]|uniref:TIGR03067 domain-containing protein n=1 Tax=Stieleria tagensis TaxID=2956795 RepID=UPI00209B1D4F|nr:TIGR03067 domain-containing protein [Stieleria tagensis]MCO8125383.1 lipocalin family protein [Stieleria tagensis]
MKLYVVLLFMCLFELDGSRSFADEPAQAHPIIGRWQVVALEGSGKMDSGISFRGMQFKFDGETWTTWPGNTTPAGIAGKPPTKRKYTIDDSHSPKHLDVTVKTKDGSRMMQTIYKIEDGKLHICMGRANGRPVAFSTEGTRNGCYVANRVENEPDEAGDQP